MKVFPRMRSPLGVALQVGSGKQVLIVAEDKKQGTLRPLKSTLLQGCEVDTNLLKERCANS